MWIMSLPADYPVSSETLRYAVGAALEAVGSGEGLSVAELVAAALLAAAPLIASGALLDFADEMHEVEEPAAPGTHGAWLRWTGAHRARVTASRVVDWQHADEMLEPGDLPRGVLGWVGPVYHVA
jgi:hypothetical protein